jgi:hypothetical protein
MDRVPMELEERSRYQDGAQGIGRARRKRFDMLFGKTERSLLIFNSRL